LLRNLVFRPDCLNAPGGVAVTMPVKAGTSPAAFRSPAATALLGATAARSTFLACCLRSIPETLADSFRLQLPLPAFAEDQSAGWAGSIATNPSSTTDSRNPRPVFTGPLPHSAISTKRDRCATGDSLPRSLPRGLPDRPLLPGSASFLSDGFPGSTLRTRYFLLGSLTEAANGVGLLLF
jgi:hypothetical protein